MQANKPLFPLGQLFATPGVLAQCTGHRLAECLIQHASGNWGELCDEDKQANIEAVACGLRVLSVYPIDPKHPVVNGKNAFWIITEADRSLTTLLLPEEY